MRVIDIYGLVLPGIPTPLLVQQGGGKAYFVANDGPSKDRIPGVWYLYQPDRGYAPKDGSPIRQVRVVNDD